MVGARSPRDGAQPDHRRRHRRREPPHGLPGAPLRAPRDGPGARVQRRQPRRAADRGVPAAGGDVGALAGPRGGVRALPAREAGHLALPPRPRAHDRHRADGGLARGDRRPRGGAGAPRPRGRLLDRRASTSSTRSSTSTSTAPHDVQSVPARFGEATALWFTKGLHLAAIAPARAAAGVAAGAGGWYMTGVALCAAVLVYENAIVRPGDTSRVQVAFAQSNGVLVDGLPRLHPRGGDAVAERELVRARGPGAAVRRAPRR